MHWWNIYFYRMKHFLFPLQGAINLSGRSTNKNLYLENMILRPESTPHQIKLGNGIALRSYLDCLTKRLDGVESGTIFTWNIYIIYIKVSDTKSFVKYISIIQVNKETILCSKTITSYNHLKKIIPLRFPYNCQKMP